MTENNYSYVIELGKTKFYKNGKFMTSSEVLNELEVKDMIINQFSEENKELKEERKGFESCSHNWGILYDEAKNKVEELSKENQKLKKQLLLANDLIDGYIALADKYRTPIKSLTLGDDLGYWNGVYQYMKKLRERIGVL